MRESGDCKMIDIKNEEDARKLEAKISEYMKKERQKPLPTVCLGLMNRMMVKA